MVFRHAQLEFPLPLPKELQLGVPMQPLTSPLIGLDALSVSASTAQSGAPMQRSIPEAARNPGVAAQKSEKENEARREKDLNRRREYDEGEGPNGEGDGVGRRGEKPEAPQTRP